MVNLEHSDLLMPYKSILGLNESLNARQFLTIPKVLVGIYIWKNFPEKTNALYYWSGNAQNLEAFFSIIFYLIKFVCVHAYLCGCFCMCRCVCVGREVSMYMCMHVCRGQRSFLKGLASVSFLRYSAHSFLGQELSLA